MTIINGCIKDSIQMRNIYIDPMSDNIKNILIF